MRHRPSQRSTIGDHALAIAGPRACNYLPVDLCLSRTFSTLKNTPEVIFVQHILPFSLAVSLTIFCTEPLKPLVLHLPLLVCHYSITLHQVATAVMETMPLVLCQSEGKGKDLNTCYSTTYMNQRVTY